jgi:Leucine-rich repeat (LRR) protein
MRHIFKQTLFCALVMSGCPEGSAPIAEPENDSFFQTQPDADSGITTEDSWSDAGAPPIMNDDEDAGVDEPTDIIVDAGTVPLETVDGGIASEEGPYTPCEGEMVVVIDNELVPVESATDANLESYWSCDLLFLKALADNSGLTIDILDVGSQGWTDGRLTTLYAGNSGLSGNLTPKVGDANKLENLSLGQNQLTGMIPKSISYLGNLTFLDLGSNRLTGAIPEQISYLTQLRTLDLSVNQLTGVIPDSIEQITGLRFLLLSHNELSGPIPPSISFLVQMVSIELFKNELTGPIPLDIGNLTALKYLSLSHNALSGPLPPTLHQLPQLTRMLISHNKLAGVIDVGICTLDIEWDSDNFSIENNHFCPVYPSCISTLMGDQDTTLCP